MSGERNNFACGKEAEALRRLRIRRLNDQLRKTMTGGQVVITKGVEAFGLIAVSSILQTIGQFDDFSSANDPYDEHDFGAIKYSGHRILFKIDYYDKQLEFGSPDPADADVTTRVMTIMLAQEY